MSATKKVSALQRLTRMWEESVLEPDAADMGTAFGLDCSLAALEHDGRDDEARSAAPSCWPDGATPAN
jgi:O-succinylbenzoate synthase